MPVITIKGQLDYYVMIEMMVYHASLDEDTRPPDWEQFLIECAVRGFEEVKKDVQVQR